MRRLPDPCGALAVRVGFFGPPAAALGRSRGSGAHASQSVQGRWDSITYNETMIFGSCPAVHGYARGNWDSADWLLLAAADCDADGINTRYYSL